MKEESYPQLIKTMWITLNKKTTLQNQKYRKKQLKNDKKRNKQIYYII